MKTLGKILIVFLISLTTVFALAENDSSVMSDSLVTESNDDMDSLFDKSLEDLMELKVGTASLTKTTKRKTPSTVTTITREDIQHSGARSLIELLEIYVPNFQWIIHGVKPRHVGLRGIIDSRDDKYLLLVNGRQMNEKTDFGVFSERDLPMLGDIREIQVVRGPGSALYGAGALAMVVNLLIDTPETFEGFEVNSRLGAIEEFYSSEFKWSKKFSDNKGLLIYGGGSIYPGANQSDSPVRYCAGRVTHFYWPGHRYYVNDYYAERSKNWNEAYRGYPKVKLHTHYTQGNWDVWARYTQGGEYIHLTEWNPWEEDHPQRDVLYGVGYRQATITTEYEQKFSDKFNVQYRFSYDQMNIETDPYSLSRELLYREDEYTGRILANWTPDEVFQFAFGGEWTHEEFGLDPLGHSNTFNYIMGDKTEMRRWGTDMRSAIGECQWKMTKKLTAFLSIRLDDHTMVDKMLSPRASFIYTPDKKNTYKLMLSRSTRTNVAEEIKRDDLNGNSNSKYERLHAIEARYERQHDKNLWLAFSFFRHSHSLVSWSYNNSRTGPVANIKSYGFEIEAKYKKDKLEAFLSHAFTKLDECSLANGITSIETTTAGNGLGANFANWANHQSKIHLNYEIKPNWLLTTNLMILWGYPGSEDYAEAQNTVRYDRKGDEAFSENYFWNAGLQYKHNENMTVRFDAYNILGWFDRDLAKRKFGFNYETPGAYRVQPPAFGVQLIYKF
ncbi:MAG: TonB-dependent receptor plug domain-containing protein [Sedimentisphaerales bacterium]|nr:TonB-dependent receptor plug domain-containing protein [Sedimentisphaerales bacterium]